MKMRRTSIRRHPKFPEKYIVTNYAGHEFTVVGKARANEIAKASKRVAAKRRAAKNKRE